MSPSTHIVTRRTKTAGIRYQVRFRWRPTDRSARYFATFPRKKDAETARAWVMTEIANGRFPEASRYFAEPTTGRTLSGMHAEWMDGRRHQVGESAQRIDRQALAHFGVLAELDPLAVKVPDVRRWVDGLLDKPLKKATVVKYLSVLRMVIDEADLPHPNPARDKRVKVGKASDQGDEMDPPSWAHFCAIFEEVAPRHQGLLVFLERTGMRITEALTFTWGDVDWRDDLLRIRGGKTRAARRWVPLLSVCRWQLEALGTPDVRVPAAPLFPGITANSMRSAMRLACEKAGIPTYTPHDLRHRYTSLLVMAGVPGPLVSRIVGHTKTSVTLDTYSHVLMDEPLERLAELRRAAFTVPAARMVAPAETTEVEG